MQNNDAASSTNPTSGGQPTYVTPKSSVAAGLLGIFLGSFGAHDWYLGDNRKGMIHLCLFGGGFLLTILSAALTAVTMFIPILSAIFGLLTALAYIVLLGNSIWGFVEGIIILAQGDAGLAAKGYPIATGTYYNPSQVSNPATPAGKTVKTTETVDDEEETAPEAKPAAKSTAKSTKSDKTAKSTSETKSAKSSDK